MKLVRGKVDNSNTSLSLFEPETDFLTGHKLQMASTIVEPNNGHEVTLVIENRGLCPVELAKDQVVGHVVPADVAVGDGLGSSECDIIPALSVGNVRVEDKRKEEVLAAVQLDENSLTAAQQDQLCMLIAENACIFALDQLELGTTGIVRHAVNTGDHPPIRQHPR